MIEIVLGLGFGDEGKGSLVDWLARRAAERVGADAVTVVRWNGGPQAAHHVVTEAGRVFCFAQLGAGSLAGARTHLGNGMVVDPIALFREAEAFDGGRVLARVSVDPRALVVTPWHATLNQMREVARGAGRHGSTGRGVAEALLAAERGLPAVRIGDADVACGLLRVREWACDESRTIETAAGGDTAGSETASELAADLEHPALNGLTLAAIERVRRELTMTTEVRAAHVILEGAQGALLDRDHGEAPWITPSRITRAAAEAAIGELGLAGIAVECWGVLRAYATRHGAGPFPTEDATLTAALPDWHNGTGPWQGPMRVGWFDAVLANRALAFAGPVDRLALTCVDRLVDLPTLRFRSASGEVNAPSIDAYVTQLEAALGRPIDLVSRGPTAAGKRLRVVI